MSLDFDVIIVGAGPAGCSAALRLARRGLKVALYERAELPRYKTCGGGLLQRTLARLDVDIRSAIERECHTATLVHHQPDLTYSCRRDRPVVTMVMRDQFDHLLAQAAMQAGAHLHPATPILDVTIAADQVRVRTAKGEATARYIVAADGVTSFVARRAGFAELSHVIPALEAEISVPPEDFERFSDAARFDFGFVPFGYAWVFPKRAHLSIGVLTTRKGSCNLNDQLARYLQALGLNRTLGEQRHGYMIPMAPRPDLFHQPRVLLVGDAAGLADPVLAEGISEAVLTGQLAADAIAEDLSALSSAPRADSDTVPSRSVATAVHRYEQKLKSALLPELKVARFLSRSLYEMPRLRAFALKRQGRRLSEYVTDVVGGTATYRDAAFSPKSYWRLLVS